MEDGKLCVEFGNDLMYLYCDCFEWRYYCLFCKYFCIIFFNIFGWDWEKLSFLYCESLIFNFDYIILSVSDN